MDVLGIFNNREIAIFVWLLLFSAFALRNKGVRESLISVVEAASSRKIVIPVITLALYTGVVCYILSRLSLWNAKLAKDTVFWFFSAGVVTMFSYVTAKDGNLPVRKFLANNLRVVVILEFIMNTFTLALWAELLIVPVATVVVFLSTYLEVTRGDRRVAKFLSGVQAVVGTVLMVYVLYRVLGNYHVLGSLDALRSFLLPILLTVTLIPAAYLMAVYSCYERLFIGFKIGREKQPRFVGYCKRAIFRNCGIRFKKISLLKPSDLINLQGKSDISRLLLKLERMNGD
jgi:hypothetical protein